MQIRLLFAAAVLWLLSSCEGAPATAAVRPTPTITASTPTVAVLASLTSTSAPTGTIPPTLTTTAMATFTTLRGQVLELSNCRYGPGQPYLYFTGLLPGSNLEIVGRREDSQWLYVSAIGGKSRCWVKASQMAVQGSVEHLEIYYPDLATLPQSPYYPPTAVTRVTRTGTQLHVVWLDIPLHPGDQEDQFMQHYIIEVWHCVGAMFVFEPLATNDTSITFTDEPGCSQPSHGRIFVQEKHGFAGPAEIPWLPYDFGPTPTPTSQR